MSWSWTARAQPAAVPTNGPAPRPTDRQFRPDIEGLRAVAIAVVVLYHYAFPFVTGGYVGVDVFFVISGFVITGGLLRERSATGRTSMFSFYARRSRRILPAATLVIVVTVVMTYALVNSAFGRSAADDGRWSAVFLADFHFSSPGVNPLASLGNYWSLAVEEQFYLVFPAVLILCMRGAGRAASSSKLAVALAVTIAGSILLSVTQTSTNVRVAYSSPFCRAWELALGALVALYLAHERHIRAKVAAGLTWAGIGAIAYSVHWYVGTSSYPGWRVIIPAVGSALVILGGSVPTAYGAGAVLSHSAFRWLGRRSYSLYLWHWPVLIVAAEMGIGSHLWSQRFPLLLGAVALTMLTYRWVEHPIHRSGLSAKRSLVLGGSLIIACVALLTVMIWITP